MACRIQVWLQIPSSFAGTTATPVTLIMPRRPAKLRPPGFAPIAPALYCREGRGSPDDVGARVRAAGGVSDDQVVGDAAGAAAYLRAQPNANGKVGVIGFCSGGRHAFLTAAKAPDDFNAL